jgi:hypothetical protein
MNKYLLLFFLISEISYAEETRPATLESKSSSVYMNYSNSIFNRPIEDFKYIKTSRGIEIYETYKHPTNQNLNPTIFPKSMPIAVIKNDKFNGRPVIYRNYTNSIFNKAIQSSTVIPASLPTYNGE